MMVGSSSDSQLKRWNARRSGGSSWSLKSLKGSNWSLKSLKMSSGNSGSEEPMVTAKYDYKARDVDELDLIKNEKLILLDDTKTWWKVKNVRDQMGFVPSNYVKRVKPSILDSLKNIKGTLGRKSSKDNSSSNRMQIQQIDQAFENGRPGYYGMSSGDRSASSSVQAKYSYIAQQTDELSFSKGDLITVQEKSSDGWWKGTKGGQTGWFPSNYVETTTTSSMAQDVMYCEPDSSELESSLQAEPLEVVLTLYPFKSNNSEELSFERDERLEVIGKPEEDPLWWKARNDRGVTGLVPRNYLRIITQETPAASAVNAYEEDKDDDAEGRMKYARDTKYEQKEWFYGKITRQEAESWLSRLADHGDFLIRQSESKIGDFTVSVKASTKNRHFLVSSSTSDGKQFKIGQQIFNSLDELVEHYTRHPIYRSDVEKLYLVKPFKL